MRNGKLTDPKALVSSAQLTPIMTNEMDFDAFMKALKEVSDAIEDNPHFKKKEYENEEW